MIDLKPVYFGLAGAGRLVRLDITGVKLMVGGKRGFWASLFWSMGLVAPLYFFLMLLRFEPATFEFKRYFAIHAETYILAWLIFPIIMERVCYSLRRTQDFLEFITAYNWLTCLYNVFYLLIGLAQISTLIEWETASSLAAILMLAGLLWIGYLAKKTLKIPYSVAVGIVILELFLGIMMSVLSSSLLASTLS